MRSSKLRDLEDTRALVAAGVDLDRALRDAPKKDGGLSPMVFAWVVGRLDLRRAASLGFDAGALQRFRDELLRRLTTNG